jgi:hypothetical protein
MVPIRGTARTRRAPVGCACRALCWLYGRFRTMRTVIFLIAGKLDFARLNPHAR